MKKLSAALAVSAGILALSACTDTTAIDQPSAVSSGLTMSATQNFTPDDGKDKKVVFMPTRNNIPDAQRDAGKVRPGSGTGIYYHGGPVLQSGTNVVAIYWSATPIYNNGPTSGTGAGSSDNSLVGYFLNHLGGSDYFGINTSYTDGSNHAIANSVNYTKYWVNDSNAPTGTTRISDTQMIAMLQSGFTSGALTYDPSTLYLIFTAGKVNLGGGFGTSYCAYHTHGTVTIGGVAQTALYAAMPYDYAYPGACTNGTASPNGDPAADGEVSVLVHEIEETTTDMMGNAWYDNRGYENADKCAWNFGTTYTSGGGVANVRIGTKDFLVQQNWKNSGSGGCVLHL